MISNAACSQRYLIHTPASLHHLSQYSSQKLVAYGISSAIRTAAFALSSKGPSESSSAPSAVGWREKIGARRAPGWPPGQLEDLCWWLSCALSPPFWIFAQSLGSKVGMWYMKAHGQMDILWWGICTHYFSGWISVWSLTGVFTSIMWPGLFLPFLLL